MALDVRKLRRIPDPPKDGNPAMEEPAAPAPAAEASSLPPAQLAEAPSMTHTPQPAKRAAWPPAAETADQARPLDGRSLRATGRTVQLNFKVTPETKARFLALVGARGVLMAELFEEAVELLDVQKAAR